VKKTKDGYLAIEYIPFIAILVEAFKEFWEFTVKFQEDASTKVEGKAFILKGHLMLIYLSEERNLHEESGCG